MENFIVIAVFAVLVVALDPVAMNRSSCKSIVPTASNGWKPIGSFSALKTGTVQESWRVTDPYVNYGCQPK